MSHKSVSIIGVVVVLAAALVGCGKKVDVANSIQPVSTALVGIRPTLEELAKLPPQQRIARLWQDWPHLDEDVIYFARSHNMIPKGAEVQSVDFFFGSLDHVRARDAMGAEHTGYFRDQIVSRLHVRGQNNPVDVIVQCLNGTFIDPKDLKRLQPLGMFVPAQRFEIGPREGLVHYVDYPLAIDLAERFKLPLYRDRLMDEEFRITPEQARRMEPDTARVQVTVRVYEGDRFDLVAGTYTLAPKKLAPSRKAYRSGKAAGRKR